MANVTCIFRWRKNTLYVHGARFLFGRERSTSKHQRREIANTQNVSIRQLLSCKHTLDVACIHIISRHHTYIQICNAIHASHNRTISLITSIPKIYQYSNSMLYAVISENQFSIPCCRSSFPFNFRITATAMLHIRQLR
jgi:hypothetical protein